jgi:hypothetical protein
MGEPMTLLRVMQGARFEARQHQPLEIVNVRDKECVADRFSSGALRFASITRQGGSMSEVFSWT